DTIPSPTAPGGVRSPRAAAPSVGQIGRQQRTVTALSRLAVLDRDISVTATIGRAGGTMTLAEAGVTVVFPRGAVSAPSRITLTAKAGSAVAYEFEPHGLTFDAPVRVEQVLAYTALGGGRPARLKTGYYQQTLDATVFGPNGSLARVTEVRDVDLDDGARPRIGTFYISHFSGYIMWSGFADGGGSDSLFPQH